MSLVSVVAAAAALSSLAPSEVAPAQPATPDTTEIVVIGDRARGVVPGPITAETALDAGAVAGLGASSIADVLAQITGLTGGSQTRLGDGPVILVNGRRIGSFDEVRNLPPEAVERVEVLPEEAALRLGYPARSKPVNIVLRRAYSAATGELEDRVTTRGLRNDFNTELNLVRIAGDNRITLDVQYQIGDSVTEAKRGVMRPTDALAVSGSGVISSTDGGPIAPLAAALAGIPPFARGLADFAAAPVADRSAAWHDLVPATQQFTAVGALNRALPGDLTLAINGRFDRIASRQQLGPAIADVIVPAASAAPFAEAVHLRWLLPEQPGQIRKLHLDTAHLGMQLAGNGAWRWSIAGNLDRVTSRQVSGGGVDAAPLQNALLAGLIADPFANPPASLLAPRPPGTTSSRDTTLGLEGFASGTIGRLPAGNANLSLSTSIGRETIVTQDSSGLHELRRNHLGGQAALSVPLLSGGAPAGALDAGASFGGDNWSDAGSLASYGANLTWHPARPLSLLLAWARDGAPPTMSQLGAPLDTTPAVAVYDYAQGRSTVVARTTGGDAALRLDRRSLWKAEFAWKAKSGLSLIATFTHIDDSAPLLAFAGVSAPFDAAFPDRIVRDGTGNLLAVDARPFNAAQESHNELRLAATFNRTFGKYPGPRVPGGGGFGGGHAFGAQGSMIQASLTDTIRLSDRLTLADGGAATDLVAADPLGDGARVTRHRVEAQFSGTHHGLGLRANAVWTSGGPAGAGSPGELRFADRLAVNARLFWFPARTSGVVRPGSWLEGVRLLLAVDNLFDTWQRVSDRSGQTPLAFQRGLVDPLGRTIRFSIRKTLE